MGHWGECKDMGKLLVVVKHTKAKVLVLVQDENADYGGEWLVWEIIGQVATSLLEVVTVLPWRMSLEWAFQSETVWVRIEYW